MQSGRRAAPRKTRFRFAVSKLGLVIGVRYGPVCHSVTVLISHPPKTASSNGFISLRNCRLLPNGKLIDRRDQEPLPPRPDDVAAIGAQMKRSATGVP